MKVALLSFHNAYNYGAALQAYGLQCALEQIGIECEYINYVNDHRKHAYDMLYHLWSALKGRNILRAVKVGLGIPFICIRGKAFERFYANYLRKTANEYHTSLEAEALNEEYDCFIVGSDQVWNPENNGYDMAYLLDFVHDSNKKISYSSSFGISRIPDRLLKNYKNLLANFSCIAVREKHGVDLIKSLIGRDAMLVLDPVFLVGKIKWDALRKKDTWNPKKKFVFFYTNQSTQVDDFFMTGYKMDGMEKHILSSHVTPLDFFNPRTRVCTFMTPERFLNEVADAELIVTASFHCLAFAIIFHKKFIVILTGDYGKDERILSLLNILGLEDRILTICTSIDDINKDIDYGAVKQKLSKYYTSSYDYLRHALLHSVYNEECSKDTLNNYFCTDSRCTGCSACIFVCPVKAIKMEVDFEGFEKPIRIKEKCIGCGKCSQVCPIFHRNESRVELQKYYAGKNTNDIRQVSSSGGCFTAISDYILNQGGVICAAEFNERFQVKHTFAVNKNQRNKMRGTFYVQSSMGNCFDRLVNYLNRNQKVLFVGTPCQVDGLRNAIGDHDNLITCDIVCHGVPSPLVFKKYISYIKGKGNLKAFSFRDKKYGYKGYTVSAQYDGSTIGRKLWLNSFNNMFSHNMINRLSCASCNYCNYDRPGDITIGDFWGLENSHPEIMDNKGISLLMVNSAKGEQLIHGIDCLTLFEVEKEDTVQNSLKRIPMVSKYRYQVMKTILSGNYEIAAKKFGENNLFGFAKEIVRRLLNK